MAENELIMARVRHTKATQDLSIRTRVRNLTTALNLSILPKGGHWLALSCLFALQISPTRIEDASFSINRQICLHSFQFFDLAHSFYALAVLFVKKKR